MEKLIELLNEYGGIKPVKLVGNRIVNERGEEVFLKEEKIISKKFGFIKWLVENEKIGLEIVKEKIGIPCFVWYTEGEISCVNDKEDYEQLLMLLSIQDNPIEFLISILK